MSDSEIKECPECGYEVEMMTKKQKTKMQEFMDAMNDRMDKSVGFQ